MKKREIYEFLYGFIDSKDIAEYLGEIEYSCDDLCEAAYIVQQSTFRTLDEKIEAWDCLVDNMPDSSMAARNKMQAIDSCKSFIKDYKSFLLKSVDQFYDSDGHIYTYQFLEGDRSKMSAMDQWRLGMSWTQSPFYYNDFESAAEHFKHNKMHCENSLVLFSKDSFCLNPEANLSEPEYLLMNHDLEAVSVLPSYFNSSEEEKVLFDQFSGMCFVFPLPFSRGDILIENSPYLPGKFFRATNFLNLSYGPFVLDYISSWDAQTLLDNGFPDGHWLVKSAEERVQDIKDNWSRESKQYYGYYLSAGGRSGYPVTRYASGGNLLNLERYTGSLEKQGMDQFLKTLSDSMTFCPDEGMFRIGPDVLLNEYQRMFGKEMNTMGPIDIQQSIDLHRGKDMNCDD